ncbi:hypothetical protein M9H77_23375 [Catharanthus roseus]|uniref:Uncharacterized protein n=1 Tax=Catharanthus roseus TaxID=4058 RepID=A0ACC0AVN1_CATRO|nr:hypothetical protein M9H77_23375 [Catharanthus roseus]
MPMLVMVKQVEAVEVVKRGKGKQVARSETPLDKLVSVQAAVNYESWTQKKRKIAPGHRVGLSDMGEIFTEGIVLKRSEDGTVAKLGAYGRILHHIISNIINLIGVGDHIGPGKIYNQNTFKRMGFERTNEGLFIRGGQQGSDDDDKEDNGDKEKGNEPESMDDGEEDT